MPAGVWSSCNDGIAAVPAGSLVAGDLSRAVAATTRATVTKAEIIWRFMGNLPFRSQKSLHHSNWLEPRRANVSCFTSHAHLMLREAPSGGLFVCDALPPPPP